MLKARNQPSHPSSASPRRRTRVAVAFDAELTQGLEFFEGVREGAMRLENWEVLPVQHGFERALTGLWEQGMLTGAIGPIVSDSWLDALDRQKRFPVVNISPLSEITRAVSVGIDYRELGRQQAALFANRGVSTVGLLGVRGQFATAELERGMLAAAGETGLAFRFLDAASPLDWVRQLGDMKGPMGVQASSDALARRLLREAVKAGVQVPRELGIFGLGNVPVESVLAGMELASVDLPWREIGRRAVEELAAEMALGVRNARTVKLPAGGVRMRESAMVCGDAEQHVVERGQGFALERLREPIGVDDMSRAAGVSRRGLETRFRRICGESPYQWLTRVRLERAKALLAGSELKISEVAAACGYAELAPFSHLFKKVTGQSPRLFREQQRVKR